MEFDKQTEKKLRDELLKSFHFIENPNTRTPKHHELASIALGVFESIKKDNRPNNDMLLNRFANEFYQHLRPSKHMTTNDISQYIIDFLDSKETDLT